MLASISPLGERTRHSRWVVTVLAYLVGSVLGGAAIGTVSAALGSAIPISWRASPAGAIVLALLLMAGLLLDRRFRGLPLPMWHRQVDEEWLSRYRGWVYGLGFGAQLGFGVVTIVSSSTVYAVALLCVSSGSWPVGLSLGMTFGVVRAAPVIAMVRVTDRRGLHRVFHRLERWGPGADRAAQVSLASAAVLLVGAAAVVTGSGGGI